MQTERISKRAKKLLELHGLTAEEIQQIVAIARINLATFDPEYRANVSQIAEQLQKSRPTIYDWADRAIAATIDSLRNIRPGRPPKDQEGLEENEALVAPEKPESSPSFLAETAAEKPEDQRLDDAPG